MRNLLRQALVAALFLAVTGLHIRHRRHTPNNLDSTGHASAEADTARRLDEADVTDGDTDSTTQSDQDTTTSEPDPSPYEPVYTYDEHGRVTSMEVRLKKGEYERGATDTSKVRGIDGIPPGYAAGNKQHRGHILGAVLGGENHTDLDPNTADPKDYFNFVPMANRVNNPLMNNVELDVDNAVQNYDKEVDYKVELTYGDDPADRTPTTVSVTAESTTSASETPPFSHNHTWQNDSSIRDKNPDGTYVNPTPARITTSWP